MKVKMRDLKPGDVVSTSMYDVTASIYLLVRLQPLDGVSLNITWMNLQTGRTGSLNYRAEDEVHWRFLNMEENA